MTIKEVMIGGKMLTALLIFVSRVIISEKKNSMMPPRNEPTRETIRVPQKPPRSGFFSTKKKNSATMKPTIK